MTNQMNNYTYVCSECPETFSSDTKYAVLIYHMEKHKEHGDHATIEREYD